MHDTKNRFGNYVFFSVLFAVFFAVFDAGAGAGYLQKVHGEVVEVVGEGEGREFVVVEEGEGFEDEWQFFKVTKT